MNKKKKLNYSAHSSCFIDKGAKIGQGTKIWHNSHIASTAIIGENCTIGQNCYIAGVVGNNCKIQNNVNVYDGVILKDFVFCGPSMTFTNDLNPRVEYPKNGKYLQTLVEKGATLGAGCTIVCKTTIGQYAFIGAGSVVTKDISSFALVYGNPAKQHGWVNKKGEKVSKKP